jgi:medium-chain acyl-[acyl-carrier-protein] hydrolase
MTAWILKHPESPTAKARLFCLPHAGGGASAYRPWCDVLAPDIEVVPVQPPGRETRFKERPYASFGPMLAELTPIIAARTDKPYALFGHSMGGHLAFELARSLRRAGAPAPQALFISARQATHLPPAAPLMGAMSDEELLATIRHRYGLGVQVDDEALYRLLLPLIRADIIATETWPPADEPPFEFPVYVMGGEQDAFVPLTGLDGWARYAAAGFERTLFPGAHFYLTAERAAVLAHLSACILKHLDG